MRKIPSLFERDFSLPDAPITRVYAVKLPSTAIATRKFDGTAVKVAHGCVYVRYDAKNGKTPPPTFEPCEDHPDPVTKHWPGWVKPDLSRREYQRLVRAFSLLRPPQDGTYELCGETINGNPENIYGHTLIPHGKMVIPNCPTDFDGLRAFLAPLDIEGIVWWDNDQPVAKIKKRDFGLSRK